jgi:hypothetical protein
MSLPFGIENHHVDVYASNINQLAQTRGFLFSGKIREDSKQGETSWHDTILPTTHKPITIKGADTPRGPVSMFRRGVSCTGYDNGVELYEDDAIRQLTDPESSVVEQQVASRNRLKNEKVINAMIGVAMQKIYGHDGPIELAALPDANKIAVDLGSTGTNTPITTGKLRALKKRFMDTGEASFVNGTEEIYLLHSPDALMAFLAWIEQNSSSNVASVQALVDGKVNKWMGFTWIPCTQIPAVSGVRPIIAWAKNGVLYNEWKTKSRIAELVEHSFSTLAYDRVDCGAVRLNDQLVNIAYCDENPA